MMPAILSNLKTFLSVPEKIEEKRECVSVLFLLLDQLQTTLAVGFSLLEANWNRHTHRHQLQSETNVWDSGVASILPEVLQGIDHLSSANDKAVQGDLVMCLLSILYLLAPQSYQAFLQSLNGEESIRVLAFARWVLVSIRVELTSFRSPRKR